MTSAPEAPVLYEERDTLAIITLNRPEKLNTLNEAVIAGIAESVERAVAPRSACTVASVFFTRWCSSRMSSVCLSSVRFRSSR